MTPPDIPEGTGIWGSAVAGMGLILWLKRYLSRDKVEGSRDAAEVNLLAALQAERNALLEELTETRKREVEVWQARNEDARLIGELSAQVAHQSDLIKTLTEQINSMRRDMHTLRDAIATVKTEEMLHYLKSRGVDFDALCAAGGKREL